MSLVKKNLLISEKEKTSLSLVNTFEDLKNVVEKNGTAEMTVETRSLEWLKENGACQDYIYVTESTIPQAGRGAFAKHTLSKGAVVITVPLLETRPRHLTVNLTHISNDTNRKSLAYNYHWSHPNSSILFLPLNDALMINHGSPRKDGAFHPNVELRWSRTDKRTMYMVKQSIDDVRKVWIIASS